MDQIQMKEKVNRDEQTFISNSLFIEEEFHITMKGKWL